MTDTPPPAAPSDSADIALEDIDKLLESEDPEFAKSLDEVRTVANDQDVTIEASAIDESLEAPDAGPLAEKSVAGRISRLKARVRLAWAGIRLRLATRMKTAVRDFIVFLKTRPKQFFFFLLVVSKRAYVSAKVPVHAYQQANRAQRLSVLTLVLASIVSVWVLFANFKGIWLPQINEPMLRSFEPFADSVETYDPKDEGESFYSAFPQERHEFLFPKMKVNLRRTAENPDPMGAFEIIILLDSKDTAIEVRDREVEFGDLLQRVFEEESFTDLESELGKSRLKSRLKRELNQKLTQGWAKEVSFKTFILKP